MVEILDIGSEGKAIARIDNLVVFVRHAVPGDIADLRIVQKKKRYLEGLPVKFHSYSKDRIEPFCSHFGVCGGCKWQQLPYDRQLFYKQKQVKDNFERLGKLPTDSMMQIIAAPEIKYYRNKLEYTFSNKRWMTADEIGNDGNLDMNALGYHIPDRFDKVLDIRECYLQPHPSDAIRNAIKTFTSENCYDFYNFRKHIGYLRNLIIRTSSLGELMIILSVGSDDDILLKPLLDNILENFPGITSLSYVINEKLNETLYDLDVVVYHGRPFIYEQLDNLKYIIGPKTFFQTNSAQAAVLYSLIREFAALRSGENVYDLYTGAGTIACYIANDCKHVTGIESVAEAIEDANANAVLNHISNASFLAGDIKDMLNDDFVKKYGKPDVIITDPPRVGMHEQVVKKILELAPERIVYVSCNPATQARDLAMMTDQYRIEKIQPVDMFPQTHHVENIVLLNRKQKL
ncbi:MAG: 23S rRNA (uracil(1939)-C(5))-methyltransferase RlmD [Bacteroidota bacterium]